MKAMISIIILLGVVGLVTLGIYLLHKWYNSEKQTAKRNIKKINRDRERRLRQARIDIIEDGKKEVIGFTRFIYEDGNIYYFRIISRNSNLYHDIKCYKKENGEYIQLGETEMIDVDFNNNLVKKKCGEIMKKIRPNGKLEDWDGVVGNVPEWLVREARLKKLLDESRTSEGTSE